MGMAGASSYPLAAEWTPEQVRGDGVIGASGAERQRRPSPHLTSSITTDYAGSEANLTGLWKLDDGAGTTALDLAGDNNGTLVGYAAGAETWVNPAVLGDDVADLLGGVRLGRAVAIMNGAQAATPAPVYGA